jgi:hypothetical protein
MFRRSLKLAIALVLIVSHVMLLAGNGYAAAPTLSLIVNPAQTDVYAGSEAVALTAKASGTGLKFKWELQGPGEIDGTGSAVFYKIPETIEGESERAIITVTVTDEAGAEVVETVIFNVLAPEKKERAAAPPPAEPKKKGMSTGTKVAIGVGAAALIGGGVALAMSGGNDEDKGPKFTGTFVRNSIGSVSGYLVYYTSTFILNQSDSSITGTFRVSGNFANCCTAVASTSVTGNVVADITAVLSWPTSPEASCYCYGVGTYRLQLNGMSRTYTLEQDGKVLRSETGEEYTQQKTSGGVPDATVTIEGEEFPLYLDGDFIRQ